MPVRIDDPGQRVMDKPARAPCRPAGMLDIACMVERVLDTIDKLFSRESRRPERGMR